MSLRAATVFALTIGASSAPYKRESRQAFADEFGSTQYEVKTAAEPVAFASTTVEKQEAAEAQVCKFASESELLSTMAAAYDFAKLTDNAAMPSEEGEEEAAHLNDPTTDTSPVVVKSK